MAIESTNTRSSFFPHSKTAKSSNVKSPYLKRNDGVRKKELEDLTKKDAKVDIPMAIKDFSRIKKAVDSSADIDNSNKIETLKNQIKAGTYNVDYDDLADKILSSEF